MGPVFFRVERVREGRRGERPGGEPVRARVRGHGAGAGERGQALVELALALPVLLVLLLGILEFGMLLNVYLTVEHGAREGARLGATGAEDQAIADRVVASCPGLDPARLEVVISPPASSRSTGDTLEVIVRFAYRPLIGLFQPILGSTFLVERRVYMRIE